MSKSINKKILSLRDTTERRYISMVQMHCKGKSVKEIASIYNVDFQMVRNAFLILRDKYGANNTAHLVWILIIHELINLK